MYFQNSKIVSVKVKGVLEFSLFILIHVTWIHSAITSTIC